MRATIRRLLVGSCLAWPLLTGFEAQAQSGLSDAILALANGPPGSIREVDGRLFGAIVDATIFDQNNNGGDFAPGDEIVFRISRGNALLEFNQADRTRAGFEQWARDNATQLLQIIFPSSLSSATLGRDAAQLYAQQLMLATILDVDPPGEPGSPRRSQAGGLVEFEWFGQTNSPGDPGGTAWQGLYSLGRFLSVQGRYASRRDGLATSGWAASADYHPYMEIPDLPVILRVGASARAGFLYSRSSSLTPSSNSIDLGTIDVGGGGWASVRKDFDRFRVGGGTLFQGTHSTVPFSDDEWGFIAQLIEERGMSWDLSYGGTIAVDTTRSAAVIGKYLETRPVAASFDRPVLRMGLIGYSFALGPGMALDAGYKIVSSGGVRSGGVFLQGHFGW